MDVEEGAGESIDICIKYSYVFIRFLSLFCIYGTRTDVLTFTLKLLPQMPKKHFSVY